MSPDGRPPEHPAAEDPPPGRDVGLAGERTRLAWRRTALAVGVVAVLTVRLALHRGTAGAMLAAVAGLGWLAVLVVAVAGLGGAPGRRPGDPGPALPLIALVTAGFAGIGVLLVLTSMR